MAAKQQLLFHLFVAMVAVMLLEATAAYEHGPEHDEPPRHHHHNHSATENNTVHGERRWPGSVSIGFHRSSQVNPEITQDMIPGGPNDHPHNAPGNDTAGERKFHWPSSATLTIHRSSQVDPEAAQDIIPGGPNNHPHNAPSNDTAGERKFHATLTFRRTSEVDTVAAQDMIPGGPNGHPHNTVGNDTEGERRFRWPGLVRTGQAIYHDPKLTEAYKLDQEERVYGLLPTLVSCNHTTQAGRTCADCTHSLLCFSNNLGVKRDCGPQHCDDGRCSPQPSANCTDTSNV